MDIDTLLHRAFPLVLAPGFILVRMIIRACERGVMSGLRQSVKAKIEVSRRIRRPRNAGRPEAWLQGVPIFLRINP